MTAYQLETVLRYAYFNGYSCSQWAEPIKQCLQQFEKDLSKDLCDVLLSHIFSATRVHNITLESYLTYALTGHSHAKQGIHIDTSKSLLDGKLFLQQLTEIDDYFAASKEYSYQWSYILKLLPTLLINIVADNSNDSEIWAPILGKMLILLSHIVAVGLYPHRQKLQQRKRYDQKYKNNNSKKISDGEDEDEDEDDRNNNTIKNQLDPSAFSFSQAPYFSFTNNTTQFAMDSQMTNTSLTFDPDSTFDIDAADATQPEPFIGQSNINSIANATTTTTNTATTNADHNINNTNNDNSNNNNSNNNNSNNNINNDNNASTMGILNESQDLINNNNDNALGNINYQQQHTSQASSLHPSTWDDSNSLTSFDRNGLEWANAIAAATIIIDLIENKSIKNQSVKTMIKKYKERQVKNGDDTKANEPWVTCHEILVPGDNEISLSTAASTASASGAHNAHIQKLLLLIERLTDRDLERRLAVHLKYHELEDEGTARAMPSAGLMGLVYYMVQIRPALDDDEIVDRLIKLQSIKGAFDESFYLELWFAALTGLREASLSVSCGPLSSKNQEKTDQGNKNDTNSCNRAVATNRLLWRNLVLVKIPYLISKFKERKQKEDLTNYSLRREPYRKLTPNQDDPNALESSLLELKTFTGLLNACSPPACCSEFYAPKSKSQNLVDKFAFGNSNDNINNDEGQQQDDIMMMINDTSYTMTADFNTPSFIKTIQSISSDDIFTNIICACQHYGFISDSKMDLLLANNNKDNNAGDDEKKKEIKKIKLEKQQSLYGDSLLGSQEELNSLLDTDMLDIDDSDQQSVQNRKTEILAQIDQNIEQRINAIQTNVTLNSLSELIHIGLVSMIHWKKIVEFLIDLLQEKAETNNIRDLSKLCTALNDCPSTIDLILQLYPPSVLLTPLENVCNEWNPSDAFMDIDSAENANSNDDGLTGVQSWYCSFGIIWKFVLIVASKFKINQTLNTIFKDKRGLCYQFFTTGPIIYGDHINDPSMEELVGNWLAALNNEGVSDDVLRSTKMQNLIQITPTLIDRLALIYQHGNISTDTFNKMISHFQKPYLQFLLVPGVTRTLCNELLNRNVNTAIKGLHQLFLNQQPTFSDNLIGLCGPSILNTLRAWKEHQRQYLRFQGKRNNNDNNNGMDTENHNEIIMEEQRQQLEDYFIRKLNLDDVDNNDKDGGGKKKHISTTPVTISNGVNRMTLFEKTRDMFRYIVKSGRSMYMNDVDGDIKTLWESTETKVPKQIVSHYLDMVMFQTALKMGGLHWFLLMIVDEVLEAGKSGGAIRAAELGSYLLTTPLMIDIHGNSTCLPMIRCLLQDIIPSSIKEYSKNNASFFQGQTLGVFVSDCLVLMYHKKGDTAYQLGEQFFDSLVMDRVQGNDISDVQLVPKINDQDGSRFASWEDDVVISPIWRGFVKGIMSNPFIQEMWPNALTTN
ncbi:unnamed protein product [Cunninghamella echinulata]